MINRIIFTLMSLVFSLGASEIYATFNVEAKNSANLAFYTGGAVSKVYVDVSSVVNKGDKLVELLNDDLKATLNIAKTSLDSAMVSLKFAKKDYDRQLLIKDLIDEATFDRYEMNYEKAKVAVSQAEANLAYQQSLLDRTIIHAPFSGVIFERSVEVGDVVSGMMLRTVFKIQSKDERKIILEFDSKYSLDVKVGDEFIYFVDGVKEEKIAKITKIYPNVNSKTRKITAEVQTQNLMPGLFGHGTIKAK